MSVMNSMCDEVDRLKEQIAELKLQREELLAALLEISQVACSLSPEQKIANSAIAKVKGE